MTTPFALLAFDLDGTLADTEALTLPDLVDCLNTNFNVPITLDFFLSHYHGMTGQPLMEALNRDFGCNLDWPTFFPIRSARLAKVFEQGIAPTLGVFQALKGASAKGYQMCVCSNSVPSRIALSLGKITGQHSAGVFLDKLFDGHIFSANDPQAPHKPKPAPDVYVAAAAYYKAQPHQCLAVEDSATGVQAAIAAGFKCVGYTGTAHNKDAASQKLQNAGATALMHHWDDFLPLLAQLES